MQTDTDLQLSIVQFQKSCESEESCDPSLKWKLLRNLSPYFLNKPNDSKFPYVSEYCSILTTLLDALGPNLLRNKEEEHLFCEYFIHGLPQYSFVILVQQLSSSSPNFQQMKIMELLESFISKGNIYSILCGECCNCDIDVLKSAERRNLWENLITFLVSLPDRVANKTKPPVKKLFSPSSYVPFLVSSTWKVLGDVHNSLSSQRDCNIEFLGILVGRLCSIGHSSVAAKILCRNFVQVCESDYVWRRIAQNLFSKIPISKLESFLAQSLLEIPWFGFVDWILGDSVLTNKKMQYLLTIKFILMRQFKNDLILQNIIGYFAHSETRWNLFNKVFHTLLDVWSDESVYKHQSFAQQYYAASAIMCCIAHVKDKNITSNKDLLQATVEGVQMRIGNSDNLVRNVGMIVGETLISVFQPDTPKPEFDYGTELPEITHLQELLHVPEKPKDIPQEENMFVFEELCSKEEQQNTKVEQSLDESSCSKNEDLDSDDDLEPYDMSNVKNLEKRNQPLYIRDCLQGLLETENSEWTEQCLRSAPGLIRSQPDDTSEVAVELAKVLLHLDDTFGMSDFLPARHRALIVLTVCCPLEAGSYLTSQFYERDYNIRQRLDILEVIAAASQGLSRPNFRMDEELSPAALPSEKEKEESWQGVIEKRLETKTRRISMGPRRTMPEPQLNLFGPVAGFFFFPLVEKFDRGNKMLNLMGDDSYVLGRLLYTLGIVMHSSTNLPVCRQMGSSLLKLIYTVHNHCDIFVRKGAIFAATMVFMSVPPSLLLSELQDEVLTCHGWLIEIIDNDGEVECQVNASRAVQVLLKNVGDELSPLNAASLKED